MLEFLEGEVPEEHSGGARKRNEFRLDKTKKRDESHRHAAKLAPRVFPFSHQGYNNVENRISY